MAKHHTGIVRRAPLTRVRHRRRQTSGQTNPIRELGEQQRARMAGHTLAIAGHLHASRGMCNVHLRSALLVWVAAGFDNRSFPHQKGLFADATRNSTSRY